MSGPRMSEADLPPSVLFVCLGNICRSPLAEAAFREAAARAGMAVSIDSAGTGDWHIGAPPDPRAQAEALRHGIDISAYRGRQVSAQDFLRYSHICALDHSNLAALRALAPAGARASLALLLDYAPGMAGAAVPDPYWGDAADFAECWRLVSLGAAGLVARLAQF